MKTLQELESMVWENDVKQKTIDLIQNAVMNLDDNYTDDSIGDYMYEVDICIEVYNPSLTKDIEILDELMKVLASKLTNEI